MKIFLVVALFLSFPSFGQADSQATKDYIRSQANVLAGPQMLGRGYVQDGRKLASEYLQSEFTRIGLSPAPGTGTFVQTYTFAVNTFPGKMSLRINGKELQPGIDYIIDAAAPSFSREGMHVKSINMSRIKDAKRLMKTMRRFHGKKVGLLNGLDSMCRTLQVPRDELVALLPQGCYLVPETAKLTWTVDQYQSQATVFYVKQDVLPGKLNKVSVDEDAVFQPSSANQNLVAVAPGAVKDTYIVFTGHYDHLGMMGDSAVFPGASDNASGISMLLYLAQYFKSHPARYSVVFIAFSGEEPGLLGSHYYVSHPVIPLPNMKFLTNIDIMGDATDGITVVNATEFPNQFGLLQHINDVAKYIPVIKSRGKAHNSDHWEFTEKGVPSFFIYSNGGKGYYHDVYDTPDQLTLNHVAGVAQLLIDFVKAME